MAAANVMGLSGSQGWRTDGGPVVGVVANAMGGYSRSVIRGIASYAASRGWTLLVEGVNVGEIPAVPIAKSGERPRRFAGLIVQASTVGDARRFARSSIPVVNVSSALPDPGLPTVITDDAAVGRLGADHFLRLGYRSLAFFAPDTRAFAKSRHEGFARRCRESEISPVLLEAEGALLPALESLARPMGIMAVNDRWALYVLDACRQQGWRVPDEIAVLGVDDDDLVQSLAYPPLSTVNTARDRVGFEAATMLDGMMTAGSTNGGGRAERRLLVPPKGVVARQSTDATAIPDADVAEAARFIHANAGRPISVEDVAQAGSVSRRQLERRFRAITGRSLLDEIVRCRVDRARQLLVDTELTLPQVALASGFSSPSYFSVVFRKVTGQTPQVFRDAFRAR